MKHLENSHTNKQTDKHTTENYKHYEKTKNNIVINRVKLESTKGAFFYKGADIFNNCI